MSDHPLVFNGINASRGSYLTPPLSPEDVSRLAQGAPLDPQHLTELKNRHRRETEAQFGPVAGVEPRDLASAGWGVVFAHDADPAVRDALRELLEHRKALASRTRPQRYKEYAGYEGYRPGEPKRSFLARHGTAAGMAADPDKVPYYLLLVASPEAIPYAFQYQLDVEYAVGRLWFETPDGKPDLGAFARYARSVVEVETGKVPLPRRATLVGVHNPDDTATGLSADYLVRPLAQKFAETRKDWTCTTLLQDQARKADVTRLLGGPDTPALLFTASHGVGFDNGDPRQIPHQGALLCQDWPGPKAWDGRPISPDYYLAADDVGDDARLLGLIAFHFACYGLGTPRLDDFPHLKSLSQPDTIAPRPFVARLPQRLLGHPEGGALAVIGHVERAWSCSFHGGFKLGSQLQAFRSTLSQLLDGYPIGYALEYFNQLYAALSTELSAELEDVKFGKIPDDWALSNIWTANNDARSYLLLGDPAVRLAVGPTADSTAQRPAIGEVVAPVSRQDGPNAEGKTSTSIPPPAMPPTPGLPGGPTRAFAQFAAAPDSRRERRQRLLLELQGRRLEEAYLRPDVRRDLEAEAADPDPDQLLTPEQLDELRDLAGQRAQAQSAPEGPVNYLFFSTDQVVIVPGFMGSELSDLAPGGHGLIWLSLSVVFRDRLSALQLGPYDGAERDLSSRVRVNANGSLPLLYDLLRADLELRRYTTLIHPVDWRKDLNLAAERLAGRLRALAEAGRPIHLIAHSQGALVARRALQLLKESGGASAALDRIKNLVLLGPANFGTFSAAFAIAGSHSLLATLRRYAVQPADRFQTVLASMTGLYQLLPWDRDRVPWLAGNDLGSPAFWVPHFTVDADRLNRFLGWGRQVDASFFNDRTSVILGDNGGAPTYAGAALVNGELRPSADGLAGDGTVPHSCAVARAPGWVMLVCPGAGASGWCVPALALRASVSQAVARAPG